jgi:hypothetical protein
MITAADVATANGLLRGLAGRVDDAALTTFRSMLAARELTMLARSLADGLEREHIPLDAGERALLARLLGAEVAGVPEPGGPPPRYTFTPTGERPSTQDESLVYLVSHLPSARRMLRAYRQPASDTAPGPGTWLYLVELDPGSEVTVPQNQLKIPDPLFGIVEVFAAGESLPPYHAAALDAAEEIWSRVV